MTDPGRPPVTVTFAGSGDASGSGGRYQGCIHLRGPGLGPVLLDCGATSLTALKGLGLDPGEVTAVLVSQTPSPTRPPMLACSSPRRTTGTRASPATCGWLTFRPAGDQIGARRVIITRMSAGMPGHQCEAPFEAARDGLAISL